MGLPDHSRGEDGNDVDGEGDEGPGPTEGLHRSEDPGHKGPEFLEESKEPGQRERERDGLLLPVPSPRGFPASVVEEDVRDVEMSTVAEEDQRLTKKTSET